MAKYVTAQGLTPAELVASTEATDAFEAKISRTGATSGQVPILQPGGGLAFGVVDGQGTAVSDANATTKGILRLAGDLGGTADAPTVPGLASKVSASELATVAKTGVYSDLTGTPTIPAAYTDEQVRDVVGATLVAGSNVTIVADDNLNKITISASGGSGGGSATAANIAVHGDQADYTRPAVSGPVIWFGSVEPTQDDDSQDVWVPVAHSLGDGTGGLTVADATTTTKGSIQLAGDLAGTADAPTVPGLTLRPKFADLAQVATLGTYSSLSGRPTSDGAAATAGLRSLGTGSQQAAPGDHTHDARYPVIVSQSGASYPARPAGAVIVIWRGTLDPGSLAADGDEWRQVAV